MEVSIGSDFSSDCEHGSAASPAQQELCLCFPQVYLSVCHLLTFISTRLSFIFYGGSASGKVWFVLHECERAQMAISSPLKEELAPGYVGVKVLYGGSGRKYFRQEHLTVAKKSFFLLPTFLCLLKPGVEIYGDLEKCLKQENRRYGKKV